MKASTDTVRVLALTNPFTREVLEACASPGMTIREIVGPTTSEQVLVFRNGERVLFEHWEHVLVDEDDIVNIINVPAGSGNDVLRLAAIVAIAWFAWAAAPALTGAGAFGSGVATGAGTSFFMSTGFWQGAIFATGVMALNALVPPPMPSMKGGNEPNRLSSLTGSRNNFSPYGQVPNLYGRHKLYPPFAALPFTEIIGNDQYFNALYCIGLGDYDINVEDIKIGETELRNFAGSEAVLADQPTFPSIIEDQLAITLSQSNAPPADGDTATRTTATNVTSIGVDLSLPVGLLFTRTDGERRSAVIDLRIEYRPVGGGAWTNVRSTDWAVATRGTQMIVGFPNNIQILPSFNGLGVTLGVSTTFSVTAQSNDGKRVGLKWSVPEGQYEVRVTRVKTYILGSHDSPTWQEAGNWRRYSAMIQWTALRGYRQTQAVNAAPGEMKFLSVRLKANEELSGIVDTLNVVATRKLPTWNGTAWTALTATRNPAWAAADVLRGAANARPLTDAQIGLPALLSWANANAAAGRTYDEVLDYTTSVFDAVRRAASVGRAALSNREGKWTFVQENPTAAPVQHFTPRNSHGFSSSKRFFKLPHALKVRFISEQADWQEDEITVYADGYNVGNATFFETLELRGIVDPDVAWKTARYHLAALQLRPEVYTFGTDIEHIVCQRGDIVRMAHDIPMWGTATARIKSISGNTIILDEKTAIASAANLVMRIRKSDGSGVLLDVTCTTGLEVDAFTRTATREGTYTGLAADDLVMLGTLGAESVNLLVLSIDPGADLSAEITAVDAAPAIMNADTGTIPPYSPGITTPANPQFIFPPQPYNVQAWSGDNLQTRLQSASTLPRMLVTWDYPSTALNTMPGTTITVRYRVGTYDIDSAQYVYGDYRYVTGIPAAEGSASIPDVEVGNSYSIQLMALSAYNSPSGYTLAIAHVVQGQTFDVDTPPAPSTDSGAARVRVFVTFPAEWEGTANVDFVEFGRGTTTNVASIVDTVRVPLRHNPAGQTVIATFMVDHTDTNYYFARLIDVEGDTGLWTAGVSGVALPSTARSIALIAEGQIFSYDNSSGTPVLIGPAAIDFVVNRNGLAGPVTWSAWDAQGVAITPVTTLLTLPGGDNLTATMSATNFANVPQNAHITIRAATEELYDEITIVRLTSGQDGLAGDAVVGVLTNEAHVEPALADGTGVTLTDAGGTFRVWKGVTEFTGNGPAYTVTGGANSGADHVRTINGVRMAINRTTGVYTLTIPTAWTTDKVTFELISVFEGVTIPKQYSLVKAKAGAQGVGVNGTRTAILDVYQWAASAPATFPVGSSTYTWATGQFTAPGALNGWSLTPPAPVVGQTLWIARQIYADSETTPTSSVTWAATTATPLSAAGTNGTPGTSPIVGLLTNEAHLLAAASNGAGYVLTGSGGTFRTWQGSTERTGAETTYSVIAPATKNGLTMAINSSGVYSLSGASWTSDAEFFTLRAVYGGVTLDLIYSIGKSKAGPDGTPSPLLSVTATSQNFKYDGAGTATPSPQTITFNTVLQNLAGTATWTATRYNSAGTSLGTVTLGGTGNSNRTLTDTQFGAAAFCVVQSTLSGLTDTITVVRVIDGAVGQRVGVLEMYRWSASAPTTYPSGNSTYTWATGAFTAPATLNSWALVPGAAVLGQTLWGISVIVSNNNVTPTDVVAWNSTTVYPVGYAGTNGSPGVNTATLFAYKRSAAAPTDNPGAVTYTFATADWTPLNSWSKTIPTGTNPVWVVAATAYGTAATDPIAAGEWSAPVQAYANGDQGPSGLNVATVFIYQRTTADTAPTKPSVDSTYTFATGGITGLNNGWTSNMPAFTGANHYLWVTTATASNTTATDVIPGAEWATPQKMAQTGAQGPEGATGYNSATVKGYKRAATQPADNPGAITYTFATAAWTPLNGWSASIPAGTDPVWVVAATAYSNTATDSIAAGEWSTPVQGYADGATGPSGVSVANVFIYQRTTADSAPTKPSTTATYTFSTGGITGLNNGWTATVPAFTGSNHFLWVTTATASAVGLTDTIAGSEWATPQKLAQTGATGTPGAVWLSGAGAPATGLGVVGDWYFNTTDSTVYEKTGAAVWTLRQNLTGAVGTPGARWFSGSGAPATGTGIVGDWYFRTDTGQVYEKTGASTWTLRRDLTGPQGPQGIEGPTGPIGPNGPAGVDGYPLNLTPGNTITYPVAETMGGWSRLDGALARVTAFTNLEGPHGGYPIILRTNSVATNGWMYLLKHDFAVNPDRSYIHFSWVRRRTTNSRGFYAGWNAQTGKIMTMAGTENANPYFIQDAYTQMSVSPWVWYLAVGVINPRGTTVSTNLSGLYHSETGVRVVNGTDFRVHDAGPTDLYVRLGQYTNNTTQTAAEGFDILPGGTFVFDGTQPTIQSMLRRVLNQGSLATLSEVTTAQLAATIKPIEIMASLPTTGNVAGRVVFLTTDSKLYRHTGSPAGADGFTRAVAGSDIVAGSVTADQLTGTTLSALAAIIGNLATRAAGSGSTPILRLSDSQSPLVIRNITDTANIFSVSQQAGVSRLAMLGDFEPYSIKTAFMFHDDAIDHLRARLGVQEVVPVDPRGGTIQMSPAPSAVITAALNTDYWYACTVPSASIQSGGQPVTLSARIYDSGEYMDAGSNQGYTAPAWTIEFQQRVAAGSWVTTGITGGNVSNGALHTVTGTAFNSVEDTIPATWWGMFSIDATVNGTFGAPVANTFYEYRIRVRRTGGSFNAPRIAFVIASEPESSQGSTSGVTLDTAQTITGQKTFNAELGLTSWRLGQINNDSMFARSNHATASGIALRNNANSNLGFLYSTTDGIGFLNNAATWSVRFSNAGAMTVGTVPSARVTTPVTFNLTTRTLAAAERNTITQHTNTTAYVYTLPSGVFLDGDFIQIFTESTGTTTIRGSTNAQTIRRFKGDGAAVVSDTTDLVLGRSSVVTLVRVSSTVWNAYGGGMP